jgi:hypothetical protein
MNKFDADTTKTEAGRRFHGHNSPTSSMHRTTASSYDDRVAELEIENSRLHRLVAELLVKNQQLRTPD